ncbi:ribosome assembly RNA-binding protein YhbY [Liquorilactobacillus mali]|uniref:YhbY domain RNA binding protein n=1 Tax=Liquorilactobacillus mali KCTC 3596 = DSM 20444 TaxID=1046596 RepID=A0A0R2EDD5_9LACO|nr:ribosome assembly RNA-binding protein YhbY [Liquorilactobacillus mali]KRN10508.1 YhbY domain RNA binding protein [Liquorilactobacillus mali KCTC 3596 = DSM 20444]MDC7951874.1 ribosome assembly RNA-binding protein YhbY [Liquorilactobacillus mali]MDV7757089.1 ribosome assembly RNA-binding protein YhbY [Liquorilactobacillus mali]QFQ75074.1 ribosome assembly RNA-binding protein YhbY [Liquorilactobacillus mali]
MNLLSGKQKKFLKAKAHNMRPIFQVGKEGVSDKWVEQIKNALDKRELIKINVLQGSDFEASEVSDYLTENTDIIVVQVIGHVLVLYRQSSKIENREISAELQNF